jgi:hypothetical protein
MIAPTARDGKGFAIMKFVMADIRSADIRIGGDTCGQSHPLTETLEKS